MTACAYCPPREVTRGDKSWHLLKIGNCHSFVWWDGRGAGGYLNEYVVSGEWRWWDNSLLGWRSTFEQTHLVLCRPLSALSPLSARPHILSALPSHAQHVEA